MQMSRRLVRRALAASVVAGMLAGTVLTIALYPSVGTLAIGLGAGGAFVMTNLLRVAVFLRLFSRSQPGRRYLGREGSIVETPRFTAGGHDK